MAFRELDYQARALRAVNDWLERLADEKANADKVAAVIAANPGLGIGLPDYPANAWARLAKDKGVPAGRAFSPRLAGDGKPVPNATLKVPTGGGKTYLACAALSAIFGRYICANNGMVLWIVPNEAIYSQTLKALRDRDHVYRQTLDRAGAGRVRILEKGDTLNAQDVAANLCVMVLMLQSSNRENQEALRLFRDRGDVHGFVPGDGAQDQHAALLDAVPNLSIYDLADGGTAAWPMVKSSMGNAMRIIRPVVIMDEGQRAVSDLAYRTLYGFNPSLVLELTATPKDVAPRAAKGVADAKPGRIANILVEITGRELEQEGMIKMPMNVAPMPGTEWQATLATAWERLEALERSARAYEGEGGRYIRPILLIQVERTGAEQADAGYIHANDARDWLKSVAALEDDQVAFKTADTNDLDKPENRDLLSPKCRVRAIITKAALAEGWDCPFAYVLCALAANGNESAMTQLVGRILRQPHASKTDYALPDGSTPLDECYVFAHRADTKKTVDAIKKGLEGDGLGDLAMDVTLSSGTAANGGAARLIERRAIFRAADIALPQVLYCEPDRAPRPLDAESDLFPHIDWGKVDLDALAARLPKDRPASDHQLVQLRAGVAGLESEQATAITGNAIFDMAYATRSVAEIVPNAFIGWGLIDALASKLRALGWSEALLGQHANFITEELRKVLERERDDQAAALFAAGLDDGMVQFTLRGDDRDWRAPATIPTAQAEGAAQLNASHGGPLERSLFLPIYKADLNDAEQSVAVYLDRYDAVRWWHRNASTRGNYGLRGWRRGNVYPDFVIAAAKDDPAGERVVVMETKGEQLAGNHDTEYKRALLDTLTAAFGRTGSAGEQLALASEGFSFGAAVVVFDDLEAQFPALIRGGAAN